MYSYKNLVIFQVMKDTVSHKSSCELNQLFKLKLKCSFTESGEEVLAYVSGKLLQILIIYQFEIVLIVEFYVLHSLLKIMNMLQQKLLLFIKILRQFLPE